MTTNTRSPRQVVQNPEPKITDHWLFDDFGQYLVRHYFAALDGKRFLLSDITQDLPVLTDMDVPTLALMLNVLQLLETDANFCNSFVV